jgi:hypothetical protein
MENNNKQGCEYCNQTVDGGINILQNNINCGDVGKLNFGFTFLNYACKPIIYLWAWYENNCGTGDSVDDEKEIEIKYCPFCGRKL